MVMGVMGVRQGICQLPVINKDIGEKRSFANPDFYSIL
jgi:hypothetical protein